eukprot:TRINITY_DN9292_c0_g2_i2.p1 TRINITY_DN9292_c0_g2~~TRINITY_DN9292_c0_g2_i2.p1  ORF type:complete len:482 (+),score=47.66 TRINITY_DN9292_c0_g2_i2:44-1489(+)
MAQCSCCSLHDAAEDEKRQELVKSVAATPEGERVFFDEPNRLSDWNTSREVCRDNSCRPIDLDLFFACAEGDPKRTKALLESGANVNARDYEERCPLHVAAGRGQRVTVVRLLLDAGAEVNVSDCWGLSPLDRAKQANHNAIQKLLISHGARLHKVRLQNKSARENWEIRRKDVSLGAVLSRTLKSVVYRGSWTDIDVVAKFCIDASMDDPEDSEELLHEIELLASLRHPDLVMFLGCSLMESPMMFITQYMPGGDLERYYRNKSQKMYSRWCPDLKTVTRWATQILRALHFLHTCSEPIIHRDLKPLNILLTDTLDVKVSDLGISKMTATKNKPDRMCATQSGSTRSSTLSIKNAGSLTSVQSTYMMTGGVGSLRYMAPEVARHENYSEKVDIFSFALVLYFMSSGRQPFHDFCDPGEILQQYSLGNELRPKASDCPSVLRPIMQSAWDSNPECRPSAAHLLRDIADVQHSKCTSICRPM